jgi:hypothetical protein
MPESRLSSEAKPKVWFRVENLLGRMHLPESKRRDWSISADGKVSVFVTFSKFYKESNRYWYDLSQDDIEKWEHYEKAFIVFVMGNHEEVLAVPLSVLQEHFRKMHILLDKGGKITLHIIREDNSYEFRELPNLDVAPFYNSYAFI